MVEVYRRFGGKYSSVFTVEENSKQATSKNQATSKLPAPGLLLF
jgi:hypothetical protein